MPGRAARRRIRSGRAGPRSEWSWRSPSTRPCRTSRGLRFVLHRLAAAFGDQLEARGAAAARARLTLELDRSFSAGERAALADDRSAPARADVRGSGDRAAADRPPGDGPAAGAGLADGAGAWRRGAGRGLPARALHAADGSNGAARLAAGQARAPLRRGSSRLDGAGGSGGDSRRGRAGRGGGRSRTGPRRRGSRRGRSARRSSR